MTTTTEYQVNKVQPLESGWLSLVNRMIFVRATIVAAMLGTILTLVCPRFT